VINEKDLKPFIPKGLTLMPFQVEAVAQAVEFLTNRPEHAIYNCYEQGLGKTIQTTVVLNYLDITHAVFIVPAVAQYTWQEEILKWSTLIKPEDIQIMDTSKSRVRPDAKYVICTYRKAASLSVTAELGEFLANNHTPALILDEAHNVKSGKAMRTKAVLREIWPRAYYRMALSGTPFTTSIADGYTLFSRMNQEAFPDFFMFTSRYCYERYTKWGTQYYGVRNAEELSKIIRSTFYLRKTKAEVMPELPEKTYTKLILPEDYLYIPKGMTKQEYKDLLKQTMQDLELGGVPKKLESHATMRREQGLLKIKPSLEWLDDLVASETPFILFAYHTEVISQLVDHFKAHKPAVITGATPAKERFNEVKRFQDGETNIFIGQIIAAGVNLTLTRASTVILFEWDWSPSTVAQAVDRAHRIGQKNAVNIYYFVVKGSIDESCAEHVMSKARAFNKVME
jgi:SWI/SNF-related matrix-associated actin-dependent regulator 1 of chromatin subfamily A